MRHSSSIRLPTPCERGNVVKAVAIVTGTSQGIGRSTAIRLARDIPSIVLVARNPGALEEVADAVKAAGAEPLVCDPSKTESAESFVKGTFDSFGKIDTLLNIWSRGPYHRQRPGDDAAGAAGVWRSGRGRTTRTSKRLPNNFGTKLR